MAFVNFTDYPLIRFTIYFKKRRGKNTFQFLLPSKIYEKLPNRKSIKISEKQMKKKKKKKKWNEKRKEYLRVSFIGEFSFVIHSGRKGHSRSPSIIFTIAFLYALTPLGSRQRIGKITQTCKRKVGVVRSEITWTGEDERPNFNTKMAEAWRVGGGTCLTAWTSGVTMILHFFPVINPFFFFYNAFLSSSSIDIIIDWIRNSRWIIIVKESVFFFFFYF